MKSLVRLDVSRWRVLFVTALAVSVAACSPILSRTLQPPGNTIVVSGYRLQPGTWRPGFTKAGAARVDITPPAGFPTGGHGPAGAMSRGYSSRLYARAFFFADSTGSTLILVSCDFFAVPGGLSAMVSRRIGERWAKRGVLIPPEAIIIAATHTHQGPGNYLTYVSLNQYGSKYPGFDKRLLDFLADRVTEAVDSAVSDGYYHGAVKLSLRHANVRTTVLMNRSPVTFLSNWNAQRLMNTWSPPIISDCHPVLEQGEARINYWDAAGCPRLRAVDRNMTLLEITRANVPVGLLIFFAVHPTVLDHSAPFYNSDFVGKAVSTLESESTSQSDRGQTVGFFNGAEGDIVPRRSGRDLRDVVRLGDTLLANIRTILCQPAEDLPVPAIATRGVMLRPGHSYGTASWGNIELPQSPLMGAAGLGGPEDDRTGLYQLGWREGLSAVPGEGQGGKLGALDSQLLPIIRLTHILTPDYAYPRELPVNYAEIGALKLVSMPGELSTAAGGMLRDSLGPHGRFEIIGLANEHTLYVATPDEYEVHDYMAASTLWGPHEMLVFAWAAVCLSHGASAPQGCRSMSSRNPFFYVGERRFSPGKPPGKIRGKQIPFGAAAVGEALNEADDGLQTVLRDARGAPERNLPRFEWTENIRNDAEEFDAAARRHVRILVRQGDNWVPRKRAGTLLTDDDLGPNFLTLVRAQPGEKDRSLETRRWTAIWLAPIFEDAPPPGEFRFDVVITFKDGTVSREFQSCPFVVNLEPAQRRVAIDSLDKGCKQ